MTEQERSPITNISIVEGWKKLTNEQVEALGIQVRTWEPNLPISYANRTIEWVELTPLRNDEATNWYQPNQREGENE